MSFTIKDFNEQFTDDNACLAYMFKERFGRMEACPKCGVVDPRYYRVHGRKVYECKDCGHQISPLAGTIFHKSATSLRSWFYVLFQFSVSKNGVSAKEIERTLGVTYKTAWRMARQVRMLMAQGGSIGGPGTTIEADETYYGGRWRGKGRGPRNKVPILGVVERAGEVRSIVSDVASTSRAMHFLVTTADKDANLHTDESRIYLWSKYQYTHESINHSKGEYARGKVTTNTIEGFWGQLKRSIDGTYHCVSPRHLQLYVDEFVFRYNLRGGSVFPALMASAVQRVQ